MVDVLARDLKSVADDVWLDERLTGGQAWWDVILEKISSADLFVMALSKASLSSEACLSEAAWARATSRPFLAVRIDDVDGRAAPPEVRRLQIVDYLPDDVQTLRELVRAVVNAPPAPAVPTQLPPPPPVPISYRDRFPELFGEAVPMRDQVRILAELKLDLNNDVHADAAAELLRILHGRGDTVWKVRDEINALLDHPNDASSRPSPVAVEPALVATPMPEVGWYVDPTQRFEHRYWDGTRWTPHVSRSGQTFLDALIES